MNSKGMQIFRYFLMCLITASVPLQIQAQSHTGQHKESGSIFVNEGGLQAARTSGDLQIHGFASQAYIITSDNDVFGNSDEGGSFGFTEIGLNALFRPIPRLQLSAQGLSRRAGEGNDGDPRIDFAFIDYRLFSQKVTQFGIRIGRLKNPFGFYNDTRDVPFTRPSILLPQSIYFDRTRNIGLSSDSIQLYGETSREKFGNISMQLGAGRAIVDDKDTELALFRGLRPGGLSTDITVLSRGIYETDNKRFRLALSGIWLNVDYDPAKNDPLGSGSVQFSPVYLSVQYNAELWSLTSEYARRHFEYSGFSVPPFSGLKFSGESFYFQGVYRFAPKWESFLRYDVLFTDRKDRHGKMFFAQFGVPAHTRYAKDTAIGIRWNVTTEFMLRSEYHYVNGTAWLSTLDNPSALNTSKHWNLFAVQASYRF